MSTRDWQAYLLEKFKRRDAHVAVIGLGYVGLPLAVIFAEAGYHVTGIDVDPSKVNSINLGISYIDDIPSTRLASVTDTGHLQASTDYSVLATCDAISICVPTPLRKTGDPDISYIVTAADHIAQYLHAGTVIILESTTYPGTTNEIILPRLTANNNGWVVGREFFLAFSPERIDPGRTDWTVETTPKVMGGVTSACCTVAKHHYETAIKNVVPVSSCEAAEMTKLLENTFRAVNIAMANEILLMCDKLGLDAWEIIEAAATKPFGFMKFTPGPGLGGHCIPIDPHYLAWKLRTLEYRARFIDLASEINSEMPRHWVQKIQDTLNDHGRAVKGSRILVLGVTYKKNVADLRESPALDIIHLLLERGADVQYHDPYVPVLHHHGIEMVSVSDLTPATEAADCLVVVTDHDYYDWPTIALHTSCLVDTRRVVPQLSSEETLCQPSL